MSDPIFLGGAIIDPETGKGIVPGQPPPDQPPAGAGEQPRFTPDETDEQREQALRDALANQEATRRLVLSRGGNVADFDRSIQDIKAKVDVIDAHRAAGEKMPDETRELVYGKLAPFADLNKGTVDLAGAVAAGVPDQTLRKVFKQEDIEKTRSSIKTTREQRAALGALSDYRTAGGYDLVTAIRKGHLADIKRAGFDPMDIVEAQSRAAMKPVTEDALSRLAPYTDSEGRVAGFKYLADHPGDKTTLRLAGFDNKTVDAWDEYARQPFVKSNPVDQYQAKVKAAGGKAIPPDLEVIFDKYDDNQLSHVANQVGAGRVTPKEVAAYRKLLSENADLRAARKEMLAAVQKRGKDRPGLSLEAFTAEYLAARDLPPGDKAGQGAAAMEYGRLYGRGAIVSSEAVRFTSQYVFEPARVLYPEVKVKDITFKEWGVGAAQAALFLIPATAPIKGAAGTLVRAGIEGTAGGLLTYGTVKDWGGMNNAERLLSVGFDVFILANAVNRVVPVGTILKEKVGQIGRTRIEDKVRSAGPTPGESQATMTKALVAAGGKRADVDAALKQIGEGMRTGNKKLLQAGARRLQIVAGQVPKELGSGTLSQYADRLLAAPDDYLKLGKGAALSKADMDHVVDGLKANKQHLDNLERALKRAKSGARQETLRQEIAKTKKIVQVQERTKTTVKPFTKPVMPGEYPLAKTGSTTKALAKIGERAKVVPKPKAKVAPATQGKSGAPGKTKTKTKGGFPWPGEREHSGRDVEGAGYVPAERKRYQPMTHAEPVTVTRTGTRLSPAPETRTQEETRPKVAPQVSPETKPQTQPQSETKTGTQTKPVTRPKPETKPFPKPDIPTPTRTPTETSQRPRLRSGASDSEKRAAILANTGAIAWRQGEVSGRGGGRRDVWIVLLHPYERRSDKITVVGRRPSGARLVRGPGSAKASIQRLYGLHLSKEVEQDVGLFDARLQPQAGRIDLSFHQDRISEGYGPISRHGRVFPLPR